MNGLDYRPDEYWEKRGGADYRTYTESPDYLKVRRSQEEFLARLLVELSPRSLLDFGCGSGKLFPCWRDVSEVVAYDRSRSQLEIARGAAREVRPERPYKIMYYLSERRTDVPFDDDRFDFVVSSEVLMHVLKSEVCDLVRELHRICRRTLCVIVPAPFEESSPHCFNHDYETLFDGLFTITHDRVAHKQRYLVGEKVASESDVQVDSGEVELTIRQLA